MEVIMIIALLVNFLVICVICVGVDYVITPIISRCQWKITRTDVATAICLAIPIVAYLAKGVGGLIEVSPLIIAGPTYVYLTKTTSAPISLKMLLVQIWENVKQMGKRISGIK